VSAQLADQRAEQEKSDKEKPYQEVEYRQFPKIGSRVAGLARVGEIRAALDAEVGPGSAA